MSLINSLIIAAIKSIFPLIKKVNTKPLYSAYIEICEIGYLMVVARGDMVPC